MKVPQIPLGVQDAIRTILTYIGEDPNREGLRETPDRVIRSFSDLYSGYSKDPAKILKTFTEGACDELVVLCGISLHSMCEHHMLPFYGKAHVAYIPNGKIVGISKLARLVEVFSRRLQIQERLTTQITECLDNVLQPLGSACVIEASHHCMCARGVNKQGAIMVTSSLTGAFKKESETRAEFFKLIGK